MNLKERGVTVGDLLIISIIVISTIFFINKFKENNRQSQMYIHQNDISTTLISQLKGNSMTLPL